MRTAARAIGLTGLIVGAMDITSAFILALSRGSTVTRLLQFVASGLLGPRAFQGGVAAPSWGLPSIFSLLSLLSPSSTR